MTLHLMQVPDWLIAAVDARSAFVDGAMVKDLASGRILAHLQPTHRLSQLILKHGLSAVTQPLTIPSALVSHLQLLDLKRMVAQVQLVASIGAAASVLNLGVSAGRFAMVLLSLKRMESKIEDISTELQVLAMHHDASFLGRCSHALRRADEAFSLVAPAERRRYWQEADKDLGLLIEEGLQIIEGQGLPLEGPSSTAMTGESRLRTLSVPAVVETLRWLATFSTARAEVLLCLGHARLAGQVSARLADWLAPLPRSAKELAMAQLAGRTLAPSQVQSVTRLAKATSSLVADGHQVAAARAALCHDLETAGVDTTEHMLRLRDDPNAQVLAWTAHR